MSVTWSTSDFQPAPCMPCGSTTPIPPVTCYCEYNFYDFNNPPGPGGNPNPFGNVAGAQAWIDNYTANCSLVASKNNSVFSGVNIGASQMDLHINTTFIIPSTNGAYTDVLFGFSAASGTTINFSIQNIISDGNTSTNYAVTFGLVDCNGNSINPDSGNSNYSVFTIPNGDPVGATMSIFGYENSTYANAQLRIDPNTNFFLSPAIALWNDSGTTRSLWACPKLLLPIKTELTAIWYADCTSAAAALADSSVAASCLGYIDSLALNSFTASGGSTPRFIGSGNNVTPFTFYPVITMYGSLNAIGGSALTINYTITSDGNNPPPSLATNVTLYDSDWNVIDTFTDGAVGVNTFTGSHVFTIPYTSKFYLEMRVQGIRKADGDDNPIVSYATGDFLFSSDGALSANPVQARYDLGLTCAGLLDCGNTCP